MQSLKQAAKTKTLMDALTNKLCGVREARGGAVSGNTQRLTGSGEGETNPNGCYTHTREFMSVNQTISVCTTLILQNHPGV